MDQPIEELYFNWLCAKVIRFEVPPTPSLTYWRLLRKLHNTEFVWLISGDDNRASDGVDLRIEFFREFLLDIDQSWLDQGCSLFEMFIAFARRAAFETEISLADWFWKFMENLGLDQVNDASEVTDDEIDIVLTTFIWRTYDENGHGGAFPIAQPRRDQRKVEIWYQFCDLLIDQDF